MASAGGLVPPFDESWNHFSSAWRKARSKGSTKSIHQLRVSTRRLVATLNLMAPFSESQRAEKLQVNFKKVLKAMGPLRDIQVQAEHLARIDGNDVIDEFKEYLADQEKQEIKEVRKHLKPGDRQQLTKQVRRLKTEFAGLNEEDEKVTDDQVRRSIQRTLRLLRNDWLKCRRRFDPGDSDTLHAMRIALKKLRYAVEAADPILGNVFKRNEREMARFQQLMGDARDLEILSIHLEKWASSKKRRKEVAPVVEEFKQKRKALIQKIVRPASRQNRMLRAQTPVPLSEKTYAIPSRKPLPTVSVA